MKNFTFLIAAFLVAMSTMAITPVVTTEWQLGAVNPSIAIESFENCPANGLPYTWTRFVENVTKGTITNADAWVGTNTERSITGTYSAKMANYTSTSDCWLVTPKLSITSTSATTVSFNWSNTADDFGSSLEVYVSESATEPVASTTFVLLKSIGEGADRAWHLENLDLTAYVGKSVYIGFKVHNFGDPANANAGGDNWWLEDVQLPLPNIIGTTGNNTRGMAYGILNSVPSLVVVSRQGGSLIRVLDAASGKITATLDPTGITGGAIAINDAAITTDGKILVSNVVTAVTNVFKIYRWDDLKSQPIVALSYTLPDASRYGDQFVVTGSITNGTAKLYAASASKLTINSVANIQKVLCWSMLADTNNPGKFKFDEANPVVLSTSIINTGNAFAVPTVCPLPNGKFIYKANGLGMNMLNTDGTLAGSVSNNALVASGGNSVNYVRTIADSTYVAYYRYGTADEKADVVRYANGDLTTAAVVASTTGLGTTTNTNGTGRVCVDASANDIFLFVLGTNNGLGKYKVAGIVDLSNGVNKTSNDKIILVTLQGKLTILGVNASSIEIYNTMGQKVKTVLNSNEIATDNLKGVFIVQVKADGKIGKTEKISL